jgi:hypothetical protein
MRMPWRPSTRLSPATRTADTSAAGSAGDSVDSLAARDPDLIVVAGEVIEEDPEPDATDSGYLAAESLADNDLVEGEAAGPPDLTTGSPVTADLTGGTPDGASLTGGRTTDGNGHAADLGQQWHDIQAMFVDDPRGSVELAAAAAEAAVSALAETLHQRQSALAPAGGTSADPGGTEQLREALRGNRIFCQNLSEIGQRLPQPATMTP